MDIMKDFEGIKKINNDLNLDIDKLYEILSKYKEQIGDVFFADDKDRIICDTTGSYCAHVYLQDDKIIIERKLDSGKIDSPHNIGESIKNVNISIADRMIEQIYDLLLDYTKHDGDYKEYITGVKKVLYSFQEERKLSDVFFIKDAAQNDIYEVKNNKLLKEYTINNVEAKMRKATINYKSKDEFNVVIYPYTTTSISKEDDTTKTTFVGNLDTRRIKITADYTDNHFIIELDDIVIGAIDSLDEVHKNNYRLEINNLDYEVLIIAINIIIDLYLDIID